MTTSRRLVIFLFYFFLAIFFNSITGNFCTAERYIVASDQKEWCPSIEREKYKFRNLKWSGMFPIYGGFIPDPHFLCSGVNDFLGPIKKLLNDLNAKYHFVDVNPFFDDSSHESLLVIESNSRLFEYQLDLAGPQISQIVGFEPADSRPSVFMGARLFPYKNQIAVLVDFSDNLQGYYLVSLPFQNGQILQIYKPGTEVFDSITRYFAMLPESDELRDYFCNTTSKSFHAFYSKYRHECGNEDRWDEKYGIDYTFEDFWKIP